ncbi:peptidase C19, ubiquitin carboxyl-terminal hydrolase 2 [Auriculariales sp. MPI-PUGE-AT-0066]|nr:peptidase C19, ubiquitin carboxyl-terminal hydrolase 2 [Auriculariales sp. MPI-PUGE-AT-0066]
MGRSSKDDRARETKAIRAKSLSTVTLPPGLYNLGNSCFFNSVFQSLLATQAIESLVRDAAGNPSAAQSPALCNGRPAGAPHDKRLPISDTFLRMAQSAWNAQDNHLRQSMSLRELLMKLGQKYDQYLDFRQQDAHELLRHLLDAISTEESDIIRERNPQPKKRRKQQQSPDPATPQPASFIDLAFGGTLASILVCAECKHVSVTHEPFYDLSLSLHTEANRERKRDKLASLANKLQSMQAFGKKPSQRKARPPRTRPADVWLPGGSESSGGIGRFFRWTKSPERSTVERAPSTSSRPGTPRTLSARSSAEFTAPKLLKRNSSTTSRPASRTASPRPSIDRDDSRPVSPAPARSPLPRSPLKTAEKVQEAYTKALLAHPSAPEGDESLLDALLSFTAVERMDGDNKIGCRTCWKKQNGTYNSDASSSSSDSESDSESDEESDAGGAQPKLLKRPSLPLRNSSIHHRANASVTSLPSMPLSGLPGSSRSQEGTDGDADGEDMLEVEEAVDRNPMRASVESLPVRRSILLVRSASASDMPCEARTTASDAVPDNPYRGPIPSIQTTAPEADADGSSGRPSKHRRESAFGGREASSAGHSASSRDPSPHRNGPTSSQPSTSTPSMDVAAPESTSESPAAITLIITEDPDMVVVDIPSSTSTPAATPTPIPSTSPPGGGASPTHMPAPDGATLSSPSSSVASLESRSSRKARKPKISSKERAKQVVRQPTLKRYLIAHAPPVLVLHLKRFQQVSSTHTSSGGGGRSKSAKLWGVGGGGGGNGMYGAGTAFDGWNKAWSNSNSTLAGFRKVDEWIEFPETLDVGPFVMPRKEDLVEPSRENIAARSTAGKYVYRLYAVVVHIGNILGGHYVAYTALPPDPRRPKSDPPPPPPSVPAVTSISTADETTSVSSVSTDATDTTMSSLNTESTTSSSTSISSTSSAASATTASASLSDSAPISPAATVQADTTEVSQTKSLPRQWCYISDTTVRTCSFEEVMKAKAYICFYERVPAL